MKLFIICCLKGDAGEYKCRGLVDWMDYMNGRSPTVNSNRWFNVNTGAKCLTVQLPFESWYEKHHILIIFLCTPICLSVWFPWKCVCGAVKPPLPCFHFPLCPQCSALLANMLVCGWVRGRAGEAGGKTKCCGGCSSLLHQSSVVRRPLGLAPSSEAGWPTGLQDTRMQARHQSERLL